MSTKRQFKMYLDDDLMERLKVAASRFNRGSGQEVAEEILTIFLPTWIATNDSLRRSIDFQTKLFLKAGERTANDEILRQAGAMRVAPKSKSGGIPLIRSSKDLEKRRDAGDAPQKKKNKRVA